MPTPGKSTAISGVRSHFGAMSAAERQVAEFVLENRGAVVSMSMMEVANGAGVSDATVLRFVRASGFDGFSAFKIALAADNLNPSEAIFESVKETDSCGTIIQKVLQSDIQLLQDTAAVLDPAMVEAALAKLQRAKRIYIYAVGTSLHTADWLYDRLYRLGYCASVVSDPYRQLTQASIASQGELFVVISRSGSPTLLVKSMRIIKGACPEAQVVALTCNPSSPVAKSANIVLCGASRETRSDISGSAVALSSIVNVLYTCLELRDIHRTVSNQQRAKDAMNLRVPL